VAAEDTVAVAGMAAEATVVVVVVTAAARMIREAEVVAAVAEATRGRPAAAVAAAIRDPVAIRSPVLLVAPHDAHLAGALPCGFNQYLSLSVTCYSKRLIAQ
jgi:hypothetical protein